MDFNFRENLRSELSYQGVMIKELSARTGIPIPTLDCYLGARATIPSVDAAFKIARALKVTVEYLLIGEEADQATIVHRKKSQEAQDLIHWVEKLNSDQCKAILNMISIFKKQSPPKKTQ